MLVVAGIAWAWAASTVNTAQVTAASLGTPGSPTAVRTGGTGDTCTSINVTWTAVTGASSYRVERNVSGTWIELAASHVTTSYGDSGNWTNYEIQYRITPKAANWFAPTPAIASIACGTGDVDDLTFTFASSCISTQLNWTTPLGTVTGYNVEYRMNGGAWTAVPGGTNIATTSLNDTTVYTTFPHGNLEYRVVARNGATIGNTSNIVAPTTGYGCLLAPTDVAASGCLINDRTVTWTAAPAPVTGYDVRRQVNGGGFTTVQPNVVGTSWNDTGSIPAGGLVEYSLYSRNSTLVDNVTSSIASMRSGFYVVSVQFVNIGTPGSLNVDDEVIVTFSQPVEPTSVTGATANIELVRNGPTSGASIHATAPGGAASAIAYISTANNIFNPSMTATGNVTWNAARTVWTWKSTSAGTAHTAPLAGTWNVGSSANRARCGTNNLLGAPVPTLSGQW